MSVKHTKKHSKKHGKKHGKTAMNRVRNAVTRMVKSARNTVKKLTGKSKKHHNSQSKTKSARRH
jgi:hypothetical protein